MSQKKKSPKPKCDHEWRLAWENQWRKCKKCARTEWYWNCQGRWRRSITDEHFWSAPALKFSGGRTGTYMEKWRRRDLLEPVTRSIWNPEKNAYEVVTERRAETLKRGQWKYNSKSPDGRKYVEYAPHVI